MIVLTRICLCLVPLPANSPHSSLLWLPGPKSELVPVLRTLLALWPSLNPDASCKRDAVLATLIPFCAPEAWPARLVELAEQAKLGLLLSHTKRAAAPQQRASALQNFRRCSNLRRSLQLLPLRALQQFLLLLRLLLRPLCQTLLLLKFPSRCFTMTTSKLMASTARPILLV